MTSLNLTNTNNLKDSFCAFIDILGFKSKTIEASKQKRAQTLLNNLLDALTKSKLALEFLQYDEKKWDHKFFTDNLVLDYPVDSDQQLDVQLAEFINVSGTYQLTMALHGFAVRGAITHGPLFMNHDVVFGMPLIEAYHLECSKNGSVNPRIILDKFCASLTSSNPDFGDSILMDEDNAVFVNYLSWSNFLDNYPPVLGSNVLERHRDFIQENLENSTDQIHEKYLWLAQYHNWFCTNASDSLETGNLAGGENLLIAKILERNFVYAQPEFNQGV